MAGKPLSHEKLQEAVDAVAAFNGNRSAAARHLRIPRPTFASRVNAAYARGYEPTPPEGSPLPSPMGPSIRDAERGPAIYVIPAAQNATPVHEGFRAAIERYIETRGATLLAIPFRYKNPTSVFPASVENAEYWHGDIADHLIAEDVELNDNLLLAAGMKIQPTAKRPLSGMETYSSDRSAIFGHTKIELESIATPQNALPKLLATTGAITIDNYTDSKAGKLGEHNHVLGALVVEIENDSTFHLRQIVAEPDGSFIDLDTYYTPRTVKPAPRPSVLTCADIHYQQMDPDVERATFGDDGIVESLRPRRVVFHDLLDFKSKNHHDASNFFEEFRKYRVGITSVYDEVRSTLAFAKSVAETVDEVAVVESNHDEAFLKWLNDGRGDKDPQNAWFYHATWAGILPEPDDDETEIGHPLRYWYRRWYGDDDLVFLERNRPYVIDGVDHHMHGDVGSNGSKGSALQFNKIGVKNTVGHNHGPAIHGGVCQVGVTQLRMRYNERGPSNWLPTHCLQYANGKRTLVTVVGDRWRGTFYD